MSKIDTYYATAEYEDGSEYFESSNDMDYLIDRMEELNIVNWDLYERWENGEEVLIDTTRTDLTTDQGTWERNPSESSKLF